MKKPVRIVVSIMVCALVMPGGLPALAVLDSVAEAYLEQGKRCFDRGDYKGAKELFKKAAVDADAPYQEKIYRATIWNNIGECYRKLATDPRYSLDMSDSEEKELVSKRDLLDLGSRYMRMSLEEKEKELGTYSIVLARGLENLAAIYVEDNRPNEAEALYRKSIGIRESKQGVGHCDTANDYLKLGDVLSHGGAFTEAQQDYEKALKIWQGCAKPGDPILGTCHHRLAMVCYKDYLRNPNSAMRQLSVAGNHYDRANTIFSEHLPQTEQNLRSLKLELKDLREDLYVVAFNAVKRKQTAMTDDSGPLVSLLNNFASAAQRCGRQEDADFARATARTIGGSR